MYRKYYLVEVIILILLSHGGWNGPSVTLLSCTSESSKLVRDVVQKRFLPLVERYRVSLPLECPLHPRRDMFWWLQTELEATRTAGEETWHCPVCGQKFRCENTFVTHWDASHARTIGMTEETVCLDDFCDVFRCDMLKKKMLKQRLEEEEEIKNAKMTDSSTEVTSLSINLKNQNHDEDDEEIRRHKLQCNSKDMNKLHNKCRSLIRQCTIGMLANLSSKDFQDIEEDLDQAICSFLTCDRYWDDFDSQIHHVPALVLAIFGLLATSFFCFCYYGTWVLLEKNPLHSNQLCCNCQKSKMEHRHRHRAQHFRYRHRSPQLISRQTSPELLSGETSPELISRKTSPELLSRQTSPQIMSRHMSPELLTGQTSDYLTGQTSPELINRHKPPDFLTTKRAPSRCGR